MKEKKYTKTQIQNLSTVPGVLSYRSLHVWTGLNFRSIRKVEIIAKCPSFANYIHISNPYCSTNSINYFISLHVRDIILEFITDNDHWTRNIELIYTKTG